MTVQTSILDAFHRLGTFLTEFCEDSHPADSQWAQELKDTVLKAGQQNSWFTQENVHYALRQWGGLLQRENLTYWLGSYRGKAPKKPKTIAVIMAGNIPLVGFHDFLCVLLSGNSVLVKPSSNDSHLLPFLSKFLVGQAPELENRIRFTEGKLSDFEAVIATGSTNTGRYFEYYFKKYPCIIRKNRNSVAVLTGTETQKELTALGQDVFRYFGLGCRSISKLMVPKGYDFASFFEAIYPYNEIINNHKYANNYDYNKAVFLMSDFKILDNNFLLIKEDGGFGSPIGTLFYEFYEDTASLTQYLEDAKENLQCVVGKINIPNTIPLGSTQLPQLNDYADGVDTLKFLMEL